MPSPVILCLVGACGLIRYSYPSHYVELVHFILKKIGDIRANRAKDQAEHIILILPHMHQFMDE